MIHATPSMVPESLDRNIPHTHKTYKYIQHVPSGSILFLLALTLPQLSIPFMESLSRFNSYFQSSLFSHLEFAVALFLSFTFSFDGFHYERVHQLWFISSCEFILKNSLHRHEEFFFALSRDRLSEKKEQKNPLVVRITQERKRRDGKKEHESEWLWNHEAAFDSV